MARPIKETPMLKGRDAKKFLQRIVDTQDKKISEKELAKMKENFSRLSAIAK
ncbi:MAG TPA: hypothetical protein VG890_13295 [Puia sp.]|nr:hypothetical protein [Puia sp.]